MKEKPIIFSGPMVRALLAGAKTQTRRLIKPQPEPPCLFLGISEDDSGRTVALWDSLSTVEVNRRLKHNIGDRLWVRESGWERPTEITQAMLRDGADTWPRFEYDADQSSTEDLNHWGWRRRPSIYMPRWASRITLTVTSVGVEHMQGISDVDCQAEGVYHIDDKLKQDATRWAASLGHSAATPKHYMRMLWDSIHGKNPEARWDANPWVVVYEFEVEARR